MGVETNRKWFLHGTVYLHAYLLTVKYRIHVELYMLYLRT